MSQKPIERIICLLFELILGIIVENMVSNNSKEFSNNIFNDLCLTAVRLIPHDIDAKDVKDVWLTSHDIDFMGNDSAFKLTFIDPTFADTVLARQKSSLFPVIEAIGGVGALQEVICLHRISKCIPLRVEFNGVPVIT